MKNPAIQPPLSLRLLSTIELPYLEREPGPLHTILRDAHSIYYSDEINHSLVSLNAIGEIRWHRSKRGKKAGEFHYPKGIELGWISENGNKTRCIAVCDSWNHRIQFFDLDGSFVTAWDLAGDISFRDVVDIRFIGTDHDSGSGSSCWLILDRGHHSLFGVDLSGRLIFRIGRALPGNLESHWPVPSDNPKLLMPPIDLLRECLPYDPLFMPLRIFGSTQEEIFVWEPKSQRLKQAILGNFLPVWTELPPGAEWIGADAQGLLCFERSLGMLGSYDSKAKTWHSALIEGTPIPSGRSSKEIWLQNGSLVHHWACTFGEEKCNERSNARPWTLSGLPDEVEGIIRAGIASADIGKLAEAATRLHDLSNKALEICADKWSDSAFVEEARSVLASSMQTFTAALSQMKGFANSIFLGLLKIRMLQSIYRAAYDRQHFSQALDRIETATRPIANLFEETLLFRDNWFFSRLAGQASGNADSAGMQEILLQEYYDALMRPVRELAKWLWCIPSFDAIHSTLESSSTENSPACSWIIAERLSPIPQSSSRYLREIDRIFVGDAAYEACVSPAAICYKPEIGFLVSLNNSGQILRLSEQGQALGLIALPTAPNNLFQKPHGIAVDDANRIWISRPQGNCIEIIDASTNKMQSLEDLAGMPLGLKYPTGIYRAFNGQMLIADTQNSRIMIATAGGQVAPLVDREGNNPGELRHPIAFCNAKEKSEFWVVEIRNHRLQRFSLNGQSLEVIGGAGLGKGRLVLPESAAIFDDGMLAVSQRACTRAVKLFSKNGHELETLQLDYSPWGMLAHNALLLVCEGNGDHIRVYERI